jgi:tripartite-type tricarboxylate transporter receptor subunit TctC
MRKAKVLILAALLAANAAAQEFPTKPLRIVVPNPAGGTVDIISRAMAQHMGPALGQNVLVDIRSGGNNIIGTEIVARAPADGHTMLMASASFATNPLHRQLPYDTLNGFMPVARVAMTPLMFAVHPSVPAKSLDELVALAKAQPKGLNYASSGAGSSIHLAAEMFQHLARMSMNLVPYQGGVQATLGVVGGHAGVLFAPVSDAAPHVASGRLRPIAVTSLQRFELMKDVPTIAESGYPGFQAASWFGIVVPAGTPKAVVNRLSSELLRALDQADVKAAFGRLGIAPAPLGPGEFDAFIRAEMRSFEDIIKRANIRIEP